MFGDETSVVSTVPACSRVPPMQLGWIYKMRLTLTEEHHVFRLYLPGTLGSHVDKAVVVCDIFSHVPHFIQPIRSEKVWNSVGSIVWKLPALIAR